MAARLHAMRRALHAALVRVESPPPDGASDWRRVLEQRGMFTYTGLSPAHVQALREKHHVYMPADGRICMAALTSASCDTFAAAVKDVLVAEKEAGGVPEGDSPARKRPRGLRGLACLS